MKKLYLLLIMTLMVFTLSGCGKDKIESKTCTRTVDSYVETTKYTATNSEIDKINAEFVYDNSLFGVETLSTLTDEQKETIKSNFLTNLGLESYTYEGLTIALDIEDQLKVTIDADLKKADADILKKLGYDFSNTNMNFDEGIKSLVEAGYTCK